CLFNRGLPEKSCSGKSGDCLTGIGEEFLPLSQIGAERDVDDVSISHDAARSRPRRMRADQVSPRGSSEWKPAPLAHEATPARASSGVKRRPQLAGEIRHFSGRDG